MTTTKLGHFSVAGLTAAPNGKSVYEALYDGPGGAKLDVLSGRTGALVTSIRVRAEPAAVAVAPNSRTVYVADSGPGQSGNTPPPRGTVAIVSAGAPKIIKTLTVGWFPSAIVSSPDGKYIYVANSGGFDLPSSISVISTSTNTIERTISVPGVISLTIDKSGSHLYALDGYGEVSAISIAEHKVVYTVEPDKRFDNLSIEQVLLSPDGKTLYALMNGDGAHGVVVAMRPSDGTVLWKQAPVDSEPFQMLITPNGKQLYVASLRYGDRAHRSHVSVISAATHHVKSIRVGYESIALAVTADGRSVVVANAGGTVSIIGTAHNVVTQTLTIPSPDFVVTSPRVPRAYVASDPDSAAAAQTSTTLLNNGPA